MKGIYIMEQMGLMNQRITKSNLSDMVFSKLKSMVLSGKWLPGERIPSEQVLSSMFGVSRLTVRIAIEKLNALRILDTRVGDGTYVTNFDFPAYISEIDDLMLSDTAIINDVNAFRTAIELCSIEQLIMSGNYDKLSDLLPLCEKLESIYIHTPVDTNSPEVQNTIKEYVAADYEFHCKICEYSGNHLVHYSYLMAKSPIIRYLTLILHKRLHEYVRDHPTIEQVFFDNFYDASLGQNLHRSILNALLDRDIELCRMIHRRMHNYSIDSAEISTLIDID